MHSMAYGSGYLLSLCHYYQFYAHDLAYVYYDKLCFSFTNLQ